MLCKTYIDFIQQEQNYRNKSDDKDQLTTFQNLWNVKLNTSKLLFRPRLPKNQNCMYFFCNLKINLFKEVCVFQCNS